MRESLIALKERRFTLSVLKACFEYALSALNAVNDGRESLWSLSNLFWAFNSGP